MERFGSRSLDRDCLELLIPHDSTKSWTPCCPAVIVHDACKLYPVLSCRTDAGNLHLSMVLFQPILRLSDLATPECRCIAKLRLAARDQEVQWSLALPADENAVIARAAKFMPKVPSRVRIGHCIRLGGFCSHDVPSGTGEPRSLKRARAKDQNVLLSPGVYPRFQYLQQKSKSHTVSSEVKLLPVPRYLQVAQPMVRQINLQVSSKTPVH